jgi:hypothetical protein
MKLQLTMVNLECFSEFSRILKLSMFWKLWRSRHDFYSTLSTVPDNASTRVRGRGTIDKTRITRSESAVSLSEDSIRLAMPLVSFVSLKQTRTASAKLKALFPKAMKMSSIEFS